MAVVIWTRGSITLMAKNVIKLPSGTYRYQRRIPKDLKSYYPGSGDLIRKNLGKDSVKAARLGAELTAQHDAEWKGLRAPESEDLGLTTTGVREAARFLLSRLGIEPGEGLNEHRRSAGGLFPQKARQGL
jgi:Domain of unknown function (DUF6538)